MRPMYIVLASLVLAVTLAVAGAQSGTSTNNGQQPPASKESATKRKNIRKNFSPDDVYKSNCTRCHAEVPKYDVRREKTILRHMRVRANLTGDEAKALLEYLTQ